MKKNILYAIALITLGLGACVNKTNTNQVEQTETIKTEVSKPLKNLVSIVEIPVSDFARARTFYQNILGISIEEMDMEGNKMGVLPSEHGTVNVVLVKGNDYKPTMDGAVVYLNAGEDLQSTLDKVEPNGGKVIVPKTPISAEMGAFALFIDSEGNKVGLHSEK